MTLVQQDDTVRVDAQIDLSAPLNSKTIVGGTPGQPRVDRALVRAVVMARVWVRALGEGDIPSLQALADREGVSSIYAGQILPLAYLAPDLVEVILDGRQPARLTLAALIDRALPHGWADQRTLFSAFA